MGGAPPSRTAENHQVCAEIVKRGESNPDNEGGRHLDRGKMILQKGSNTREGPMPSRPLSTASASVSPDRHKANRKCDCLDHPHGYSEFDRLFVEGLRETGWLRDPTAPVAYSTYQVLLFLFSLTCEVNKGRKY